MDFSHGLGLMVVFRQGSTHGPGHGGGPDWPLKLILITASPQV